MANRPVRRNSIKALATTLVNGPVNGGENVRLWLDTWVIPEISYLEPKVGEQIQILRKGREKSVN